MSFLGPGLQIGGALAGGASRGIQMGQESQMRQQEIEMRRAQMQDREADSRRKEAMATAMMALKERQVGAEETKANAYKQRVGAEAAAYNPVGKNDLGIPEQLPVKYAGSMSGWAKQHQAGKALEARMALGWGKLKMESLVKLRRQAVDEEHLAAADAAKQQDLWNKADELSRATRMKATPASDVEMKQYELQKQAHATSKESAIRRKQDAAARIHALDIHLAKRGLGDPSALQESAPVSRPDFGAPPPPSSASLDEPSEDIE